MADQWLADLAVEGRLGRTAQARQAGELAAIILRAQIINFNRRKHLLAVGDEFAKRQIKSAIAHGDLPRIYMHCSRCGACAWLSDWLKAADYNEKDMAPLTEARPNRVADLAVLFLKECPANDYLFDVAEIIDAEWLNRAVAPAAEDDDLPF